MARHPPKRSIVRDRVSNGSEADHRDDPGEVRAAGDRLGLGHDNFLLHRRLVDESAGEGLGGQQERRGRADDQLHDDILLNAGLPYR